MLNYFCGSFDPFDRRRDAGELLENFVAKHLLAYAEKVYFYRSESGGEVDFVVKNVPVEVKMSRRVGRAAR